MAQVTEKLPSIIDFENAAVAVPEALTTVLDIPVSDIDELGLELVVATNDLDQFAVLGQFHRNGAFVTLHNTGTDFTTPVGLIVGASGDLTAQAVGTGWLILDTRPLYAVRLRAASGNAAGSSVSVRGHGSGAAGL